MTFLYFLSVVSPAVAADMSWTCNALTAPEDALPYRDADVTAGQTAFDLAESWMTCTTRACDVPSSGSRACTEAQCTTDAGAVVTFRDETTHDDDGFARYTWQTVSLTVSPPATETWTDLEVVYQHTDRSWTGYGESDEWTVSWRGVLDPSWPTDGSFEASSASAGDYISTSSEKNWDDGACAWELRTSDPGEGTLYTVDVNLDRVEVNYAGMDCLYDAWETAGWLNDVYLGVVDRTTWEVTYPDGDGDTCASTVDCDDTDAAISPRASETCNGRDDDCDGHTDTTDVWGRAPTDAATWYPDHDGDGFGTPAHPRAACGTPAGYVSIVGDCDDVASGVHPGAAETCDAVDQDCDGFIDEYARDGLTWYRDADGDLYGTPLVRTRVCTGPAGYVGRRGDCNDTDAGTHPRTAELPNGLDDDCDGAIDEGA